MALDLPKNIVTYMNDINLFLIDVVPIDEDSLLEI